MFGAEITTKDGRRRKILNFPYSSLQAEKVKTIFGHRYFHTEQRLSYPQFQGILTKILKVFGGKGIQSSQTLQLKSSFVQSTNPVITKRPEPGDEIPKRSRKGQSLLTLSGCNFKGQRYRFTTTDLKMNQRKVVYFNGKCNQVSGTVLQCFSNMQTLGDILLGREKAAMHLCMKMIRYLMTGG